MKLDFHTHTTFSDGILDPEALVALAGERGVNLLSVSDHDCLDAIPIAEKKAKALGITLYAGVELNTDWKGGEVHVLGYGFDPADKSLNEKLQSQRDYRRHRLQTMLYKLQKAGFDLDEKRVFEIAGNGAAGRPHLALALIEKKYVGTVEEAFDKYLAYGRVAWAPRSQFTPKDAVEAIAAAGGIPVLAHPGRAGKVSLDELVGYGLKGVEVFYPTHPPSLIKELLAKAKKYGLLVTGGSDYHGINPGETGPGCVDVPEEYIAGIQKALSGRERGAFGSTAREEKSA